MSNDKTCMINYTLRKRKYKLLNIHGTNYESDGCTYRLCIGLQNVKRWTYLDHISFKICLVNGLENKQ